MLLLISGSLVGANTSADLCGRMVLKGKLWQNMNLGLGLLIFKVAAPLTLIPLQIVSYTSRTSPFGKL